MGSEKKWIPREEVEHGRWDEAESRMVMVLAIYISIIYTPNLGFGITLFDREREQGRFRGSSEGARGSNEGATREQGGAR